MRSLAGKDIVHAEVGGIHEDAHRGPGEVHGAESAADGVADIGDEAEVVQLARHTDKDSEPGERVPRRLLA